MESNHNQEDMSPLTDVLRKKALEWTPSQWQQAASELDPDQISAVVEIATSGYDPLQWREKVFALIHGIAGQQQLEAVGKSMHVCQLLELLNIVLTKKIDFQQKLSPLFAGMPTFLFRWLIVKAKDSHLKILKQEAVTEVLQHHLTLLARQLSLEGKEFYDKLSQEEQEIQNLNLGEILTEEIDAHFYTLKNLREEGLSIIKDAATGLALAWNTNRTDLINQFGAVKEITLKTINEVIGNPTDQHVSTGLWRTLENKLADIFKNTEIPSKKPDDEPIMEALVHFSIWYLRDYWEVGLLPHVNLEALQLANDKDLDQELFNQREKLFTMVSNNLAKLGLKKQADLKRKRIYSKKALTNYVRAHQKKLE